MGPEPDPRESEEWFQVLDTDAQDVVRQRWLTEEIEWEQVGIQSRRDLGGSLAQGAVLLGGLQLTLVVTLGMFLSHFTGGMTYGVAIAQIGLATLIGMGLGALWVRIDATVLLCPLTALLAAALLEWFLVRRGSIPFIALFCGPMLAGLGGRYVGVRRDSLPGC